jgi:hypothetical protein
VIRVQGELSALLQQLSTESADRHQSEPELDGWRTDRRIIAEAGTIVPDTRHQIGVFCSNQTQ